MFAVLTSVFPYLGQKDYCQFLIFYVYKVASLYRFQHYVKLLFLEETKESMLLV